MSANLTQSETAARASAVTVHAYRVDVDIRDAEQPGVETFPVTSEIELTAHGDTWLDFLGESVHSVSVDGLPEPIEYDGARIRLASLPVTRCTVRVEARARYSRTGEGLHRFTDPADSQMYLYTQYEPADARRVFPCFEQPDMRAPFTFTLTGPAHWWLGSNEPVESREELASDLVKVQFAQTRPLSTYITCLCAGPYHRETQTWQGMELGLLCRASLTPYLDGEELFRLTSQGMEWYTTHFGPYPWGTKYDQIFVPEYNLGAMENPGLVTFTEAYLFRSPATPAQLQARANTLVHEMSHMWFGDLVTCKWWGDLWLKESFAEFMGSHVSVEANGFDDGWVNFATGRKVGAYQADAMPTTHPVVAHIDDLEAAKTNFDRITYSKGAATLTQLVRYVGLDAFLAGSRRYFAEHAYGAGTLRDFVAALDAETSRDLSGWVAAWLESSGHDTLHPRVALNTEGRIAELVIDRIRPDEARRPHATTVGLYQLQAGHLELQRRIPVVVDADATVIHEAAGEAAPDLILINDLDYTFAAVGFDDRSTQVLRGHIGDLDPLARAVAWTALRTSLRAGDVSAREFVESVLASGETQSGILTSVLGWALTAVAHYTPHDDASAVATLWRDGAHEALRAARPGSPEQQLWAKAYLRATALAPHDVRWLLMGSVPGLDLSVDLTWLIWETLATQGEASEAELDAVLAQDDTAAGRTARLRCWAAQPEPAVKAEAWRRAHLVGGETNEQVDALLAGFGALGQGELRAPFADDYFARLIDTWREQPIEIAMRLVRGGYPDDPMQGRRWLSDNPEAPATLRRLVIESTFEEEIALTLRSHRG